MVEEESSNPERTCAGCRASDESDALLRFAVTREASMPLVPDVNKKLGGRGVSVHPTRACLEAAIKRGGFARSLKRPVPVDLETLATQAAEQYRHRVRGLIGSAIRGKKAVLGTDSVREAFHTMPVAALLVAEDAAGRRDDLIYAATQLGARCIVFGNKADLGTLAGRAELAVLAILDGAIAAEVARAAQRAADLSEDE